MSLSWDLGPPDEGAFFRFLRSQFFSKAQRPNESTSLHGKVAIVTGATSGLGLESSRQMLSLGLSGLIIAARSLEKGGKTSTELRIAYPKADLQVWLLNMESYNSVRAFARRAAAELSRLDIVILNAGTQVLDLEIVPETGREKLLQVNFLSTMLLGILLLPVLKEKSPPDEPGRLTIVSSGTARASVIPGPRGSSVLPPMSDKTQPWNPITRYAVTKLLGHLIITNLARQVDSNDVVVNLADPGLVKDTNLQGGAPWYLVIVFYCMKSLAGRRLQDGASTYVDAVVLKGRESHGCYISDWKISPFAVFVYTPEGVAAQKQLWKETMSEFEFAEAQNVLDGLRKT